jgi:hypothetical protein
MKRPPREILLDLDHETRRKLDMVRQRVIAGECGSIAQREDHQPVFRSLAQAWNQLFWSCRKTWSALAAAWIVVVLLNFDSSHAVGDGQRASPPRAPGISFSIHLLDQQMITDLSNPDPAVPPPVKPPPPKTGSLSSMSNNQLA